MRDPAGAEHRLGRAAAALAVGALVGPELEGDRDDLAPRLALPQRGDGGVDPAAERHQHALAVARRHRRAVRPEPARPESAR